MAKCKDCNEIFTRSDNRNAHYREFHQLMNCGICKKIYYGSGALTRHQQLVHGVEKKHKCCKCTKGFDRKSSLVCHAKTCKAEAEKTNNSITRRSQRPFSVRYSYASNSRNVTKNYRVMQNLPEQVRIQKLFVKLSLKLNVTQPKSFQLQEMSLLT